ncbi:MAG: hypothetical protein QNJ97_22070 [Myxococcota bacterium]|nr:hypothetical protein [Myxococcota bacterium]
MKNAKSIEVAYNIVRYRDPLTEFVDWDATPSNPKGNRGSILRYESPLSALLLAGIYSVVDSADFTVRLKTARYFVLAHLIVAYILVCLFCLRQTPFAVLVFTFLFTYAFFTVFYATKPQAETFSLFYQALFLVTATGLMRSQRSVWLRTGIIAGLAGLLSLGGKMNYFLIALPVVAIYPFIDRQFSEKKDKFLYFLLLTVIVLMTLSGLILFADMDLKKIFVFMIKGNKPILDGGLWATFVEGFNGFETVWHRTLADFGAVSFWGGIAGSLYLLPKFIYLQRKSVRSQISYYESFQIILFVFAIGHAVNYIVLRNLFIPHRYYVVPIYMIFCLTFTVLVVDALRFAAHGGGFRKLLIVFQRVAAIEKMSAVILTGCLIGLAILAIGAVAFYFGEKLIADETFRRWYIDTMKYYGSRKLALVLSQEAINGAVILKNIGIVAACISGIVFVATAISVVVRSRKTIPSRFLSWIAARLPRLGITVPSILLSTLLASLAVFAFLQNTQLLYSDDLSQQANIKVAKSLGKVREGTRSGDLVLCWKLCYAFYADKRSIIEAREADLDYYIANDVHALLGPVKPLNLYYRPIKTYAPPATYYRLKPLSEIEEIRKYHFPLKTRWGYGESKQ